MHCEMRDDKVNIKQVVVQKRSHRCFNLQTSVQIK